MKSICICATLAIGSLFAAVSVHAQPAQYGAPSLLPLPQVAQRYPTSTAPASSYYRSPPPNAAYVSNSTRVGDEELPPHGHGSRSMGYCDAGYCDAGGCKSGPCGDSCDGCSSCNPCCAPKCWFGGAGALWMTRDHGKNVWLSFDGAAPGVGLMSSQDADMSWSDCWLSGNNPQ